MKGEPRSFFQEESFRAFLAGFDEALDQWVPPEDAAPVRLHQAMRYSLQAGGKRLRPALLTMVCEALGGVRDPWPAAVAVECIHTYSLIHDDLPCMDDSELRRGKATCHMAFDEATAVLAGDALLPLAFEMMSRAYGEEPKLAVQLVEVLAKASGSSCLVGGQVFDLIGGGVGESELDRLKDLHSRKTGALIQASVLMGAKVAGADCATQEQLAGVGAEVGLVFQIVDDWLDATAASEVLGKTSGRDADLGKRTFVDLLGLEGCRSEIEALSERTRQTLKTIPGDWGPFSRLIQAMAERRA